jgi:general secretion pathway protein K
MMRQRGVAVVTALLVAAMAVTLVTGLFWQQQLLARGMEGQRLQVQGRLIVRAALDAACLALREADARGGVTVPGGAWSAPVLPGVADAALDAALTQHIEDAQSRFNLRNLAPAGRINLFQVSAFARLLDALRLDPALAYRVAEAMSGGARMLEPQRVEDLATLREFTPAVLARLREFVVLLPEPTAVNVNTASAEVLTSVANFSLQDARGLVERRRQAWFKDGADFAVRLNDKETLEGVDYQVSSSYFLVRSRLRLQRAQLDTQALVQRRSSGGKAATALLWLRDD